MLIKLVKFIVHSERRNFPPSQQNAAVWLSQDSFQCVVWEVSEG